MSKERPSVGHLHRGNPQVADLEPSDDPGGPVLTYRRMTPAPGSSLFTSTRSNNVPAAELCQRCRERPAEDGTYCYDCGEIQNSLFKIASEIKVPGAPAGDPSLDASLLRRRTPEGATPSPSELQRSSSLAGGSLFDELLEEVKQIQEPVRAAEPPPVEPLQERTPKKGMDLSSLHKLGAVGAASGTPSSHQTRPSPPPSDIFAEDDVLEDLFAEEDAQLPDLFSEDDAPLPDLFAENDAPLPDLLAGAPAPVRGGLEGAAGTLRHSPDKPLARDLPIHRPSPTQYIKGAATEDTGRRSPHGKALKPTQPLSEAQAHDVDSLLLDLIQVSDAPPPPPKSPLRFLVYTAIVAITLGVAAGVLMYLNR